MKLFPNRIIAFARSARDASVLIGIGRAAAAAGRLPTGGVQSASGAGGTDVGGKAGEGRGRADRRPRTRPCRAAKCSRTGPRRANDHVWISMFVNSARRRAAAAHDFADDATARQRRRCCCCCCGLPVRQQFVHLTLRLYRSYTAT